MVAPGHLNVMVMVLTSVAAGLVVFSGPVTEYLHAEEAEWSSKEKANNSAWNAAVITMLQWIYVTCCATTFGSVLWVTFIAEEIMFMNLPRHQFGNLAGHLFPVFFRLNSATTAAEISIFAILHPLASSTLWERLQTGALGLSLVFTLINLLVLGPITTKLMGARYKAEREDGIPTEPGVIRKKEIESGSPNLRAINKKFTTVHSISKLINHVAFWAQFAHLFYLAGNLTL